MHAPPQSTVRLETTALLCFHSLSEQLVPPTPRWACSNRRWRSQTTSWSDPSRPSPAHRNRVLLFSGSAIDGCSNTPTRVGGLCLALFFFVMTSCEHPSFSCDFHTAWRTLLVGWKSASSSVQAPPGGANKFDFDLPWFSNLLSDGESWNREVCAVRFMLCFFS